MAKESSDAGREDLPQNQSDTPEWHALQDSLANDSGLSLLLVDGHQPPELHVSNNNSICQALQASPRHVKLCDPYCGEAHRRAQDAGQTTQYRCHAGLHCFVTPVAIGEKRNRAVIGGRAFLSAADYRTVIARFREGDLQDLPLEHAFENVVFSVAGDLEHLASRLEQAVEGFNRRQRDRGPVNSEQEKTLPPSAGEAAGGTSKLEDEITRLKQELNSQARFAESLQYFLERISSRDPEQAYVAILMNCKELLQSERASLFVFDEAKKELTLKAAIGLKAEPSEVEPIPTGHGISGGAWASGQPVIVSNLESEGIVPAPRERLYKTKSFISYPITIGGRKVGLLNLTDKVGGSAYNQVDLSLLEIIAPQLALALERAEWQEKATQFQLMSITDPLTGLPNRRYLEERLGEEVNRSKRYEHQLSFLMIDIDDFKLYNDRNGHQAGDVALQMTAQCLKSALRSADVAARFGGEEFCILLPQTSLGEARVIAERMREKIESTKYPHAKSQPLGAVTISVGIATFSTGVDSAERIVWAADHALYEAKREGKNQIRFYQESQLKIVKANGR